MSGPANGSACSPARLLHAGDRDPARHALAAFEQRDPQRGHRPRPPPAAVRPSSGTAWLAGQDEKALSTALKLCRHELREEALDRAKIEVVLRKVST